MSAKEKQIQSRIDINAKIVCAKIGKGNLTGRLLKNKNVTVSSPHFYSWTP